MVALSTTRNQSLGEEGILFLPKMGKNVVSTARNLSQDQEGAPFPQNEKKGCAYRQVVPRMGKRVVSTTRIQSLGNYGTTFSPTGRREYVCSQKPKPGPGGYFFFGKHKNGVSGCVCLQPDTNP